MVQISSQDYFQVDRPPCNPQELDNVESVEVDDVDECLEHCDGVIMDAVKLTSERDQEELEQFIADYEKYKYNGIPLPDTMKGDNFKQTKYNKL